MTLYCYHWNIICFIVTTLTFPYWPSPPAVQSIVALTVLIIASYQMPFLCWTRGFSLALILVSFHSYLFASKVENAFHAGNDITINVRIDSFFKQITRGNEYLVKIESINSKPIAFFVRPQVKLITPEDAHFKLGEKWQLTVRMTPVLGKLNEAGFDQEQYFISQGWHAKATLDSLEYASQLKESVSIRLAVYERVAEHIHTLQNRAVLLALSFGNRNELTPELWTKLKNSGLIHLVAISGLHIGIAYLFGWKVGCVVRLIFTRWFSAPTMFALIFALIYAWLAGFSIPTLRALYMCAFLGFFSYLRIHFSPWQIVLYTLSVLLLLDPFAMLSSSFWLSFIAVISIYSLLTYQRVTSTGWVVKIVVMQLALTLIMLPTTIFYFSGFSLTSCIFNLVFVPWFSLVVVPLLFVSLILTITAPLLAGYVWPIVDSLLFPVNWSINYANDSWIHVSYAKMPVILAILVMLIIRPVMSKKSGCTVGMSLFFVTCSLAIKPKSDWQLSMLDVGHGLALLIEKNGQYVLYDTGNKWEGGSVAETIIDPIFRYRGIKKLDVLILSHFDSDHAGGRKYIEKTYSPTSKYSSQKVVGYLPCVAKQNWDWNGLRFLVVWPPKIVNRAYNPHSCVIKISDGVSSVLLTGDIEAVSEYLLLKEGEIIQSEILIVPHHGSKTSSTDNWLEMVKPELGLASVSKGSRWNLPNEQVVKRYTDRGVIWLDTGENGQISINFSKTGWRISTLRSRQSLYWYRQKLRNRVE